MLVGEQEDGAHRLHCDARSDSLLAQRLQSSEQIPGTIIMIRYNMLQQ